MTSFNFENIFKQILADLFSYMEIPHKFMCEVPESSLNSTEQVNTLVNVLGDIEGNIVYSYTIKTGNEIAAKLMGRDINEVSISDFFTKAALTDFFSDFSKRVLHMIRLENLFDSYNLVKDYTLLSSSPTYISGDNLYGIISKVSSRKIFFKVDGEKFDIAYSLWKK